MVLLLCFGYAVAARTFRRQRQLSALEQELETARRIQASILPAALPAVPGGALAVRYAPAAAQAQRADASYGTQEIPVETGDRLVLYTDGLTEATGPDGEPFGVERLVALLEAQADHRADPLAGLVLQEVREWTGRSSFEDDVSLVVLDVGPLG